MQPMRVEGTVNLLKNTGSHIYSVTCRNIKYCIYLNTSDVRFISLPT